MYKFTFLKDVCELITKGTTPLAFSNTGIKFIKIDSLNGTSIDNSKVGYISDEIHFGVLKRSILKENDILLAIAGATVGKHAIVKLENLPANTNQALAIIRLNGPILPTYLLSIFDTDLIPNYVRNICTASAQPNLNLVQVGNLYFGYPEMHEQEKINNFIEKIDSRIETQNKIISALESQKKAIMNHILNAFEFNEITLKDLEKKKYIRLVKPSDLKPFSGTRKYLSTSSINEHGVCQIESIITFDNRPSRAAMMPIENSVWFAKMKNSIKVYKATKTDENEYILSTGFYGCIPDEIHLSSNWLKEIFLSDYFNSQKDKFSEGGTMSGIKDNQLSDIKVKIFNSIDEEKLCTNLMTQLTNKLNVEIDLLQKYKEQKKFLLSNMFI